MSLLAQQVAGLMKAYQPHVPRRGTGRLHVIADDTEEEPTAIVTEKPCRTCGITKPLRDFYHRATRNECDTQCKTCTCEAKRNKGKTT